MTRIWGVLRALTQCQLSLMTTVHSTGIAMEFNNPYKYVDPGGNFAFLIPVAIWAGKGLAVGGAFFGGYEVGTNGYQLYTGEKTPEEASKGAAIGVVQGAVLKGAGGKIAKYASSKLADRADTEIVQRWMSQAELDATAQTGLIRGGRDGTHYVADSANSSAKRARQRLALP